MSADPGPSPPEPPVAVDPSKAAEEKPAPVSPTKRFRWLLALVVAYAIPTFVVAVLVRFFTDRFWLATVLAFMPRWLIALPAPLVLGLCLLKREKKLALAVVACVLVQAFFVGDLHVNVCRAAPPDRTLRLLTQNAMRTPFENGWLAKLVKSENLDLVLVQECPIQPGMQAISPVDGYQLALDSGMCLLSRYPITEEDLRPRRDVWEKGGAGEISLYRIDAPFGAFYVLNLHLSTVRDGLAGFIRFHAGGVATMRESTELRHWESRLARDWSRRAKGPLIVAGDFNLPRESAIFKESWGDLGSAFDACGTGFGYSKETVVRGIEFGTRIDHVLFDDHWRCHGARLGPPIGSDHRGMIAVLSLE